MDVEGVFVLRTRTHKRLFKSAVDFLVNIDGCRGSLLTLEGRGRYRLVTSILERHEVATHGLELAIQAVFLDRQSSEHFGLVGEGCAALGHQRPTKLSRNRSLLVELQTALCWKSSEVLTSVDLGRLKTYCFLCSRLNVEQVLAQFVLLNHGLFFSRLLVV